MTTRPSCHAVISSDDQGGIAVAVVVPTYEGGASFQITVERDGDGDWRVSIPWPERVYVNGNQWISFDPSVNSIEAELDGMHVANGLLYLGAPDDEEDEGA